MGSGDWFISGESSRVMTDWSPWLWLPCSLPIAADWFDRWNQHWMESTCKCILACIGTRVNGGNPTTICWANTGKLICPPHAPLTFLCSAHPTSINVTIFHIGCIIGVCIIFHAFLYLPSAYVSCCQDLKAAISAAWGSHFETAGVQFWSQT